MLPQYHTKKSPSATLSVKAPDSAPLRQTLRTASEGGLPAPPARDAAATWINLQHLLALQDSAAEDRVSVECW